MAETLSDSSNLRIEIFTTDNYPIAVQSNQPSDTDEQFHDLQIRYYHLDTIGNLENQLSYQLPPDPDKAKAIALSRLKSLDQYVQKNLQQSAEGLAKAVQYGLARYPAIVFIEADILAVVYGVSNLAQAVQRYREWRQEEGQSQ